MWNLKNKKSSKFSNLYVAIVQELAMKKSMYGFSLMCHIGTSHAPIVVGFFLLNINICLFKKHPLPCDNTRY
jgi:hypothetical protein